jgi:hypothetical protein
VTEFGVLGRKPLSARLRRAASVLAVALRSLDIVVRVLELRLAVPRVEEVDFSLLLPRPVIQTLPPTAISIRSMGGERRLGLGIRKTRGGVF